jgi:hypothetical protein
MLWLMALVAVGFVGFAQGRRYEQTQLQAERDRLAKPTFQALARNPRLFLVFD